MMFIFLSGAGACGADGADDMVYEEAKLGKLLCKAQQAPAGK